MIRRLKDKDRNSLYDCINYACRSDIEKYKFFMNSCKMKPLKNSSFKKLEYISLVDGKIQGYFAFILDKINCKIINIELISFDETRVFVRDFLKFCEYLDNNFKNIELFVIPENPAYRIARRGFLRYSFNKIGNLEKSIRLIDGKFYDVEIWQKRRSET